MITTYFYDEQIRDYMIQFCAIFSGLTIKTGIGQSGTSEFISVPIHIGNKDRVVAAIINRDNQNTMFELPIMSTHLVNIEMVPERRKGLNVVDKKLILKRGEVYPDDLRVVTRLVPIPYDLTMELSMYASNTLQVHQILEQLLILFDPTLQIQKNDAPFDWTKITSVELTSITNEENYPIGTDRRIQIWTLSFKLPIWLSPPLDIKDEIVRKIIIRIGDLKGFDVTEFDENGELQPFQTIYSITTIEPE